MLLAEATALNCDEEEAVIGESSECCSPSEDMLRDAGKQHCCSTMDLELSGRPFYGRKQELELLSKIYGDHSSSSTEDAWPIERSVLVQGASGTGKTALVHHFVSQLSPRLLTLQGKYEEMTRQDPFSAIEQAFDNYFRSAMTTSSREDPDQGSHQRQRTKILNEIGGEVGLDVLRGVLPALSGWLAMDGRAGVEDPGFSPEQSRAGSLANISKSHQLHYVFGRLVQAMIRDASLPHVRPLVLVLDNLQWADTASLALLVYLVKQNIPHFLLIGTCRTPPSNHEKYGDDLTRVQRLADYSHVVALESHNYKEIVDYVSQELSLKDSECEALAKVVHEKTKGNFLLTRHLMDQLRQRQPAISDGATCTKSSEVWKEEDILKCVEQIKVHTIGDAASDKICHLPNPSVRRALMVASYLGSKFTVRNLHSLCSHIISARKGTASDDDCLDNDSMTPLLTEKTLVQLLDVAVLEGLLCNNVGSTTYQFAHDGIQVAAYNMMPAGPKRDQMLYQVGLFLKEEAPYLDGEDWMLFVAARHWSEIRYTGCLDYVELAWLYLQCGSKAIGRAAYEEASKWLKEGQTALILIEGINVWEDHYELALRLHESAAEAELLLGNYDEGYRLGNMVLENARDLLDKMPIYYAMDAALGLQDRHDEALNLNMEVLTELNQVPTTIMAIRDFFQVKRLIRDTSDEEILSLPAVTNPYHIASARCLANACMRAYCSGKMLLMMAITLRQVKLTLQFGLCPESPIFFAQYGVALISGMGHPSTGLRMGQIARRLASRQEFNKHACKTLYFVGSFIELWSVPFETAIETFDRAHELGLLSGNHDYGYGAEVDAIITSFMAGNSLEKISNRFEKTKKEIDQYSLDALKCIIKPLGVLLIHLIGQDPTLTNASATCPASDCCIDWVTLEKKGEIHPDSSNHYTLTYTFLDHMILGYFMDNITFAEHMMKKFHVIAPSQSYIFCTLGSFFSALVCAKLARNSKYSKYKTLAQKYSKEMKKLVDNGCTKNSHKYDLLKAECMSLCRGHKNSLLQQAYDKAILSAKESGCQHDHALANELAGEHYLRQTQPLEANCHFIAACSLYKEWGAHNKVRQLMKKHDGLSMDDLPATSAKTEQFPLKFYPSINLGSTAAGSVGDDLSALTPIPENSAVGGSNRWGTGGGEAPKHTVCAPPKPPRRPMRT